MVKKSMLVLGTLLVCLFTTACSEAKQNTCVLKDKPAISSAIAAKPPMVQKPIEWGTERSKLQKAYAQKHYGMDIDAIIPKAIVLHWTAAGNWEGTYRYFYSSRRHNAPKELNVGSHYLVGRDGTIYQLMPETALARHAIGFNWCAIGIENVGGVNGKEDLTEAQVRANIALVKYLSNKYKTIEYVFGHYQQKEAQKTPLYIEKVTGYHSDKVDPGPKFMKAVHNAFKDKDLIFFAE